MESTLTCIIEDDVRTDERGVHNHGGCKMSDLGFTPEDRRALTTLEVEVKHINEAVSGLLTRMTKMEDSRASQRDLEQMYTEIDEVRQEKAEKKTAIENAERLSDHEDRIRFLEKRQWIGYGIIVGSVFVIEAIFHLIVGK